MRSSLNRLGKQQVALILADHMVSRFKIYSFVTTKREDWFIKSHESFRIIESVLKALDSNTISSQLLWGCSQLLVKLYRLNKLFLMWLLGHNADNEEADMIDWLHSI